MVTLFDQFGRPIESPKKKPDSRPLAAAPLTNAFRDYVADGLTPGRLGAILKEADAGDLGRQAELFDQIEERDGHLIGEMGKRRNVILDADFTLSPASEDSRDVKVCEDVKKMLEEITDWPDTLESMQDSVGKGFATVELGWDNSEGQSQVQKFDFIEQKRFRFTDRAGLLSKVPLLITDDDPLGIDIPPWRTMMHRYGGKSGHSVRSGLYRLCAWWYLFKNYAIKDWVIFCEVYGMPLRLGKYDSGASKDDKEALEIAVRTLGHDAAGIISKATEIEFVEGGSGSVSADLYKDLAGFANKEMSKAILGGTLTADVDGKGSYAAANTHNDVRHDLINADARSLAATVRSQFIRPWVGFNYGWDTKVPKYVGSFKKENLKAHAEMLDKFADRMEIGVSYVRTKFNIPAPEEGEETLQPKIGQISASMGNMSHSIAGLPNDSRNGNLDILDMVSTRLGGAADEHINGMTEKVKTIIGKTTSLGELKIALAGEFKEMDTEGLGLLIAKAMAAVELTGRYEVENNG